MSRLIVTTSWDDGNILDIKLSRILTKYNIKGTFYVPKCHKRTRKANLLREDHIQELANQHEVGAHTINHVHLAKVSITEAKKEIEESKLYLENIVGKNIEMFCYPYGEYSDEVKEIIRNAGFIGARTMDYRGSEHTGDPFEWGVSLVASDRSPRINLNIWRKSKISYKSLFDWKVRAKLLFDMALIKGGVYHLWGHSWEIDNASDWAKLESVLDYISNREDVFYATNGDCLRSHQEV